MIGIDPRTGRTLNDWDQFVERATQVMTTPLGSREHRRGFGCRVRETLAHNMGDDLLLQAQAYATDAFYNPINGIGDFTPSVVLAERGASGVRLSFAGTWRNRRATFEVQT